ncbi:DUF397 domain-containing protein [Actinomadura rupiterrae]|uniref:DUF397 domain-containing protein n=1 Tax=Actinomadura rupiterrae TaxID=559627 RepID=UPI0020A356BC|nr:DUF397 domain-containing protein [Actinomadura rupiterrae]
MSTADWSAARWRKSSYSGNTGGQCVEVADIAWRTSSHSTNTGGQCVEVGDVAWQRSSHSGAGGNCVEVAGAAAVVAVRDSQDPEGPKLLLSASAWTELLSRARG